MLRVTQLSGFGAGGAAAAIGVVTAAAGSYALTGTAASVRKPFAAAAGSYALTGSAASLVNSGDPAGNFLARTSGLDGTHITAYTNLINGLVTDGIWSKLDMLHVYATQDSTTARLNLVSTSYNGTLQGSPTFTADRGYTGIDGAPATVWIDTGFNPATASSPKYVQNSAHVSVWGASNTGQASQAPIGNNNLSVGTDVIPTLTDNNAYIQINSTAFVSAGTNTNPQGHYIANRTTSSAVQGYKNGSSIVSNSSNTSSAPANFVMTVLACNFNSTPRGSNLQCAMASIGSSLSSGDALAFYNRLRTYMTAVGVP